MIGESEKACDNGVTRGGNEVMNQNHKITSGISRRDFLKGAAASAVGFAAAFVFLFTGLVCCGLYFRFFL